MAAGRPGRVKQLFEGFGYAPLDINFALKRRLMAGWQEQAGDFLQI